MIFPIQDDNPTRRFPIATVAIIVLNVFSLLYVSQLNDFKQRVLTRYFGFVPKRIEQIKNQQPLTLDLYPDEHIRRMQGLPVPPGSQRRLELPPERLNICMTLVTSLFLHGGLMHLLSNMWFLWLFGNNIEDRLGSIPFLWFYILGGVAATLCHAYASRGAGAEVPVIGASGAVAVTLGAYAVTFPVARVKCLIFIVIFFTFVELPALVVLGFWFAGQLIHGLQGLNFNMGGGVAWWAHVGGFTVGALIMPFLRQETNKR